MPEGAGGEDAYSAAIALLESFGGRWREVPLTVFSTDADPDAVSRARAGRYPIHAGEGIPSDRLDRFFTREPHRIRVRPFLRGACRFARVEAGRMPPFSRLDVIDCRGTLAGLPSPARQKALERFRASLAPGGMLLDSSGDEPELFADVARERLVVAPSTDAGLRAELRSAEERDAFVGEVVHELRTPISVIRASVETLLRKGRGGPGRKFLGFIDRHTVRMAGLVDQLLNLNTADAPKPEGALAPIPLAAAVWELAAAFVPVAKRRGISLKIDIPASLAVVADPADIPHIVGNLVDNAIKFSPKGGAVYITGRVEGGDGVLSVRDTGAGLAPDELGKVFERFFRGAGARRVKGTGLGLAIVARMVKANGGRVAAANAPAGGAVFSVALPLARPEPSRGRRR